jgi:hypothetical protein
MKAAWSCVELGGVGVTSKGWLTQIPIALIDTSMRAIALFSPVRTDGASVPALLLRLRFRQLNTESVVLRHGLRRGRNSKAVPSSDSIPASAAAPSGPANRNSGAAVRNRSGSAAAALSSLNQSNFWFDLLFTRALPPNTLTSSYYCRHSNKHARRKPNSLGHNFSGAAFGWSSFLTFVSRRSLPLQSAPPVNPACAALRGAYPKPRRARFRALRLRSAPEIDSASLRSFPRHL